ncbi:HAD-IA family hydrolase [Croceicoccus sp. F390]|uniref:HAD-IA family hydrolase n=1 Tax=Croceicoccus esteveae TaxID=3075597 RepID=A0ABU2ZH33_9SPHN|nr:HAD-IA family hydrolase [Croceicoccus sp. F390]MDT0575902.1 HAD-IA family hydrolase [Croceicoccus sp. F390]
MAKKALLLGSIGAIAETSDIQRRAYNQALREHDVEWQWDKDTYAQLLGQAGGKERLTLLAKATGANLSEDKIDAIHKRKTEIACEEVRSSSDVIRPGVAALVRKAKEEGMKLGFVTTTYRPNVDAVLASANGAISADDFDVIVVRDDVESGKPAPDAYEKALRALGVKPEEAIAIEDTENSVAAARRAGVEVVATRGAFTADQDVSQADLVLQSLDNGSGLDPQLLDRIA